jgi:hypothetical protein
MADKNGGDVSQVNGASQGNISTQAVSGTANTGPAAIHSVGGAALLSQVGTQLIEQHLDQLNLGFGGYGGSDNIEGNKEIHI